MLLSFKRVLLSLFAAGLVGLSGCETAPPVQEMSDARQAIAVAKEAEVADAAARELASAETYLQSAEQKLGERDYSRARNDAIEAKLRAIRALKLSESGKNTPYN
ncbi:MAG: DUF4398 domain-containing protein [Pseudomonadota bacterium]